MKVEELIAALSELKDVQSKVEVATQQVVEAQAHAVSLVDEATRQAATIVAEAKQQAQSATVEFAAREKAVAQREADVESREAAVAWVKDKEVELQSREAQVVASQQDTDRLQSAALASKQAWDTRQAELDSKAAELEKRLTKLTEWEQRLRQNLPVADLVNS